MTICLNVLCLILIMLGIILSPKNYQNTQRGKMEKRLSIQTIISATSLLLLYVQNFTPSYTDSLDYKVASYTTWMLQYYPSMFIIFFITPTISSEFLGFYFSWLKKVNFINLSSTSVTPFAP